MPVQVPTKFIFPQNLSGYNRTVQALNDELSEVNVKIHKPLGVIGAENLVETMREVGVRLVNIKLIGDQLGGIVDALDKGRGMDPKEKKVIQNVLGKILLMQSNRTISSFSRSIKDINSAMNQLSAFSETLNTDLSHVKDEIAQNKRRQETAVTE